MHLEVKSRQANVVWLSPNSLKRRAVLEKFKTCGSQGIQSCRNSLAVVLSANAKLE